MWGQNSSTNCNTMDNESERARALRTASYEQSDLDRAKEIANLFGGNGMSQVEQCVLVADLLRRFREYDANSS